MDKTQDACDRLECTGKASISIHERIYKKGRIPLDVTFILCGSCYREWVAKPMTFRSQLDRTRARY